jgi:hypothetical protein
MITRDEYLNALELIDKYHRQNLKNLTKTHVTDFIKKYEIRLSTRLKNVLEKAANTTDERFNISYIEDITFDKFARLRDAGRKSWQELKDLLQEHRNG